MKHLGFSLLVACLLIIGRASAAPLLYVDDANENIGIVDVATGAVTVIGNMGAGVTGLAFDPTGNLYGISSTDLYQIDPNAGVATDIGPTGILDGNAVTFDGYGDLYGAGGQTTNLYYINDESGAATEITNTGFDSAGDLTFYGSELYLSASTNQLVEIDAGTFTFVTTVEGNFSVANVVGLATGDNGVLYGVSGTKIFAIDPATGAATFVVDYGGQGLGAAVGAAFSDQAVPYITSALMAAGQVAASFSYQITAANVPYFFEADGLPAGLTYNDTGLISGTPTQAGTFSVYLSAFNPGGGVGSATLTLTIAQEPGPVITSTSSITAKTNKFFLYQIAATETPTSFTAGALPAGLSFYPTGGFISGTPTQTGTFNIAFSATNSGGTASGTLTLTIVPGPPVPEVVTLSANIPHVTAGSGAVGEFLITRLGANQSANLRVGFSIKGSAVNGSDYTLLKDFVILKPGQTSVKIPIRPLGDGAGPGVKRSVRLVLTAGSGYIPETASSSEVEIIGH